ncbi:MAG: GNAT family N-acetyltransferase [Pseudonocardiaceae bacterium]|nr:GNAT family N-acetyltransferase [Pseudonocardiaceae bacterium]
MTQSQLLVSTASTGTDHKSDAAQYSLILTRESDEVVAAQRLRYHVFAEEMGARLASADTGLDQDPFDEFCDHLVVRDERSGEIVGTYRMMPPERARQCGQLYADTEFDLRALDELRPALVETGRSCVHPDHRSGAVVGLVWAGIARYMLLSGWRYLGGCASVQLCDGGSFAAGVWDTVRAKHYAAERHRVHPLHPWDDAGVPRPERVAIPPLLRGYLRLGAQVCGPPAHDPEFDVADLFVLLDLERVDQRYLRFFLGEQG